MELHEFLFCVGIRQVVKTGDATPKFLKSEQSSFTVSNPYTISATSGSITGCLTSLYSTSKSTHATYSMYVSFVIAGHPKHCSMPPRFLYYKRLVLDSEVL